MLSMKKNLKVNLKSDLNTCNDFVVLGEGVALLHRPAEQTAKRRSPCVTVSEAGSNKSAELC